MRTRRKQLVRGGLVTATTALGLALLVPVAPAGAEDFGGSIAAAPNVNYGCEAGPRLFNANGDYGVFESGSPNCTWWHLPTRGQDGFSTVQPNGSVQQSGLVTAVRVRSGPNPAPLRFTVVRTIIGRDASGGVPSQGSAACCFGQQTTRTFALRPNAVTTIPLNLPVENRYDAINNASIIDAVGFSSTSNTGTIPVRVTNSRPSADQSFTPGNPSVALLYPEVTPGQTRTDSFSAPSHLITAVFTMCTSGPSGRVAAETAELGASSCGARVTSGRLTARNGKVKLPIKAVGSAKGKILLKSAKGGKKLATTKKFSVGANGKAKVSVKLTGLGKKLTRGKRTVRAKLIVRSQGATKTKKILVK